MNTIPVNSYNTYPYAQNMRSSLQSKLSVAVNSIPVQNNSVSFRGGATIGEHYMKQLLNEAKTIKVRATSYLDTLESVANSLKDCGISFDRVYCERHPVKSADSCVSKVIRSGSFLLPDRIRATLYCKNINDLSILVDHILPQMEKRGYIIAETEVSLAELMKKGYVPKPHEIGKKEIKIPDIDIRLNDVSDQVTKLPENLRDHSISHAQGSGYEDIQIRFVREIDSKQKPMLHELIILCGENYSKAKHWDSTKLYDFTRQFGELSFLKNGSAEQDIAIANRYVALIKNLISSEVSKKAFENAKNLDMYGIKEGLPIKVLPDDVKLLKNYFIEIESKLESYYAKARKSGHNTDSYNHKLMQSYQKDKEKLATIKEGLLESIEFYNKGGHLKAPVELY